MIRCKKKISFVIVAVLVVTLFFAGMRIVNADEEKKVTCVAASARATVFGDFMEANSLGTNWTPSNTQTMMHQYSNGIYELTVDIKTAGTYKYKIAMNGTDAECYGTDGKDIPLNITEPKQVNFKFDYKTKKVYDSVNNPTEFKASATLTGSLPDANWVPATAKYDMTYIGNGFYKETFNLPAQNYGYKVAYNHAWDNGEVGADVSFEIKSKTDVTFIANPDLGICTDSITNPSILDTLSLIGTLRGDESKNWVDTEKGYEFSYLNNKGYFIYDGVFPKGDYKYKAVQNYNWSKAYPGDDKNISIENENQYVIFIVDPKTGNVFDSVNDPNEVDKELGFVKESEDSVSIEADGTITFRYTDPNAKNVYVAGSITDWEKSKQAMTKVNEDGLWKVSIRRPLDAAETIEYKFIVDGNWISDPLNPPSISGGNSTFDCPEYKGRTIVLAGNIQSVAGEKAWNASSEITKMKYIGHGNYSITLNSVPAGNYEYKVAMGSWEPENYGAKGISFGSNMPVNVPGTQDVTFYYSDDSHYTVDSISYKPLDISLTGTGIPADTKMTNINYRNLYYAKVLLSAGTYDDFVIHVDGKNINVDKLTVSQEKWVNICYDPVSGIAYEDSSELKLANDVYFDSRNIEYKEPYGAVTPGQEITFNLNAGSNKLKIAKLKVITPTGVEIIEMTKNGTFDDGHEKWTAKYSSKEIGVYSYAFIISNGSDAKAYADKDGNWGEGGLNDIGVDLDFGFNIYDPSFKTPDWMKNAVVYQIFPDRFFNGDLTNDYAQTNSRGETNYEFYDDWYSTTEIPSKVVEDKENYNGVVGDGVWCNEMYGGDLNGIEQKLDYLQSLGVNVLYMNPISQSISNHRYDATDYSKVDPLLGNMEDFESLVKAAKERGMHIILDGVFNHVSDDSIYFDRYGHFVEAGKPLGAYQYWSKIYDKMAADKSLTQEAAKDIVEKEYIAQGITDFHYADWFTINNEITTSKDSDLERYDYEGWWGYDSMPVIKALNGSEYNVSTWADEIIDGEDANSRFWLEEGSNGWRLDVANEVSDETWEKFRDAVKEEGDNVIIGEIWTDASRYLLGNMYDSVMNYRFRDSVIAFINNTASADEIVNKFEVVREQYPKEAFDALLNLVDSHDTERILFNFTGKDANTQYFAEPASEEALAKMRLVPLMQMTYPGAPCIYYGDEAGMNGSKDPDCRRGMIWGKGDKDLVEWYAKLTNIRNNYEVLRTGDIIPQKSPTNDILCYDRVNKDNLAIVMINRGGEDSVVLDVSAKDGTKFTDALNPTQTYTVADGKITVKVDALSGVILVKNYKEINVNYANLESIYNPEYIVETKARVSSLELNEDEASLETNDTVKLEATVSPENATLKDVIWTSSDEKVATVSADGTVTAKASGSAVITAKSLDGNFEKSCTVTVTGDVLNPTQTTDDTSSTIAPTQTTDDTSAIAPTQTTDDKSSGASTQSEDSTDKTKAKNPGAAQNPNTGYESLIVIILSIALVSAATLVVVRKRRKLKKAN